MKNLNLFGLFLAIIVLVSACKDDVETETGTTYTFEAGIATQADVQEALILFEAGDKIIFGAGTFSFTSTLSADGKTDMIIEGAGMNETFLDFTDQISGAEGLKINNCNSILMYNFTVQNAEGDGVKATDCDGISFYNVGAVWTGPVSSDNGGYGLYPVLCTNVMMDGCYVRGASDAGIYVGQSQTIIVRNCTAEENVAGIEIENSISADVYGNTARNNTGGILIFDLPGLTISNGTTHRLFNNTLDGNSHPNFAASGNIVASVPSGTGIMLLAAKNVEIFDNTITNNNVMGIGFIDYMTLVTLGGLTIDDPNYVSAISGIYIHDNTISRTTEYPTEQTDLGAFLTDILFPAGDIPDYVYDGFSGSNETENILCFDNPGGTFVNINVPAGFDPQLTDITPHLCIQDRLAEVTVVAPTP
ncbi:MAG: parallel beta-helix repeat protein [Maribacter sp.]|jgi:parallel beta-helix repeat protein